MIKIETNLEEGGVNIKGEIGGKGIDLVNEILTIIQTLMSDIKEKDEFLHAIALNAIVNNFYILTGETEEEFYARHELEGVKIVKGVN